MLKTNKNIKLSSLHILAIGIFTGLFLIFLYRFILFNPPSTHIHANFAVSINGQLEPFEDFIYYEETSACNTGDHSSPKQRVHMHEPNNDLVHVHDDGVTWNHFWESLGWTVSNNFIQTRTDAYSIDDSNKITLILNDKVVQSLNSKLINDSDKLIVSYGDQDLSTIKQQYDKISSSASEYNEISDPASCSGAVSTGLVERLKYSLGISNK